MVREYTYSPHVDFYIEKVDRQNAYNMDTFHIHHKFEIYYEVEGTRRYFIEDASYIVNAGNVVLIGENQIHKTNAVGDGPSSRIVVNFSHEYLDEISKAFPELDFCTFLNEEDNHLLSGLSVKQQNHIQSVLQQILALQEEQSPEREAACKMLLATLLLDLKRMCEDQRRLGGHGPQSVEDLGQAEIQDEQLRNIGRGAEKGDVDPGRPLDDGQAALHRQGQDHAQRQSQQKGGDAQNQGVGYFDDQPGELI